jgi:ATPase subunit of ABC transporter with duplicated ATPase domains
MEWRFTIGSAPRSSSVVATLDEATATLGRFTFGRGSLQVTAGDRVGVTGPNGAGETTRPQLLLGRLGPRRREPAWALRSGRRDRRARTGLALESYEGALLLVTHDRRLWDNSRLTSAGRSKTAGSPPHKSAELQHGR